MSGYVMIPGWLLDRQPSANAIAVYCRLAQFGKFDTDAGVYEECRPRLATLAAKAGMSESTVKRGVAELLELGAITRTLRWSDDGKTSLPTVYRVVFGSVTGPGPGPGGSTGGPPPNRGTSDLGGSTGEPGGGPPVDPGGFTGELQPRTNDLEVFDPEENLSPPPVRTEVAHARESSKGEGDSTDSPKPEPRQSVLDALVAELHTLTPGHSPEALRDALEAAREAGRDPALVATAALALARGDFGATQWSFKSRLLTDGPWWRVTELAPVSADPVERCGRHRGQPADNCGPCRADAAVDDPEPARLAKPLDDPRAEARAVAAAGAAARQARAAERALADRAKRAAVTGVTDVDHGSLLPA